MAMYTCSRCHNFIDNDHSPMNEKEECIDCQEDVPWFSTDNQDLKNEVKNEKRIQRPM